MPSPVAGSKKSAASPTNIAPCATIRDDRTAKGPVARILRTISPALDPVTHLGKVPQCLVEEALDATPCAASPIGGYDERHVGLIMSDLVQSDVCPLSKMQLGRRRPSGPPR